MSSRDRLITVALPIFAERGLEGAVTRDIAAAAGMPMSQITYHFGGKAGLYNACATHIAGFIQAGLRSALPDNGPENGFADMPDRDRIKAILGEMVRLMATEQSAPIASFISREQMAPTAAFSIVFEGAMRRPITVLIAALSALARGAINEAEARVRAIALVGQVMAFRVARAAVLTITGWERLGETELAAIHAVIDAHVDAICDQLESRQGSKP